MREDWIECTLGEVCEKALKVKRKEMLISDKIKYLDIGGIDNHSNKIISHKNYTWEDAPSRAQQIIKQDDVLFSTVRTYLKNIAKVNKEEYNNEICSSGFTVLRAKKNILNSDFLFFRSLSTAFLNALNKLQRGTSYPAVRDKDVFSQKIPIPHLVEQKAIVNKIEELFSSLDSGIADLKKAQDQLVIYRQAVLKKAFEGELTKEWREKQTNLPSAEELLEQIKEERQKHYKQQLTDWKEAVKLWKKNEKKGKKPLKPKFIKELPSFNSKELEQLPYLNEFWKWIKVDKIASHEGSSLKAGPFGSSLKKEFYTESGFKIYGQEQVISNNYRIGNYYVNQEKYDSLINCAIKPFDILISLVGTIGKVLVLPEDCEKGIINPRLVKITLNSFYDSIFFKYYFESAFLKNIYSLKTHGATMNILNLGIIKELPYPLSSKQEQNQIVREIESRLSVCDKVEESISESLEKAQALRQSILKKAFEGKLLSEEEITKCKEDKDYEPASVLLERIRAINGHKS